jgi:hypothetical protein
MTERRKPGTPIFIFFAVRMHHVAEFYWFGINSMAVQKGDGLGFLEMLFDMLSAAIAVLALLIVVSTLLVERLRGGP